MKKLSTIPFLILAACGASTSSPSIEEAIHHSDSALIEYSATMGVIGGTKCPAGTADAVLLPAPDSPAGPYFNSLTLHQATADSGSMQLGAYTAIANITATERSSYCALLTTAAASCSVPNLSGSVGALAANLPNQTPPGYITAVIANGTQTLQVTYQTTGGTTQTNPVISGDPKITFTGGWQKNGHLTAVSATDNTISFNNGQGTITVSGATVSGRAIWSGLNSGVGQVTGSGTSLLMTGYNANSGNEQLPIRFTSVCSKEALVTFYWDGTSCPNGLCPESRSPTMTVP